MGNNYKIIDYLRKVIISEVLTKDITFRLADLSELFIAARSCCYNTTC